MAVGVLAATPAWAGKGAVKASMDPDWQNAPSARYAALDGAACLSELRKRAIAFEPVAEARGVVTPVRVIDGVGGVLYRTAQSREKRATSPYDVVDCRLVLALDDFSAILKRHGIDEVLMFSGWRPPPKSWPVDKPAVRHPAAMAIDLFRFGRWVPVDEPAAPPADSPPADAKGPPSDQPPAKEPAGDATPGESAPSDATPGKSAPSDATPGKSAPSDATPGERPAGNTPRAEEPTSSPAAASAATHKPPSDAKGNAKRTREWLDVKEQFEGKVGAQTCGAEVPSDKLGPQARLLRSIVCEAAERRLFTTILTPNYNEAHHNHVHLDLTPGARWRLAR